MKRNARSGLTTVELIAALGVLLVLVTAAIPLKRWDDKRRRENKLRDDLHMMREAIDLYKKAADQGRIQQKDVDQKGNPTDVGFYPTDLEELVKGVDVTNLVSGLPQKIYYLREVPVDPFTGDREWGLRSYQDDWDTTSWGGENVWDVYSLSPGKALDGTWYKDW